MLGYYLMKIFAQSFRLVPFWLLYIYSDVLRFILYYIVRYRRTVAFDNLHRAFPEKSEKEIREIAWKSYRNLTDIIFESFKGMVISEKTIKKRFKMDNPEVLDGFANKNKNVIFLAGHCANWEWAIISDKYVKAKVISVFKPLKNPRVNSYMKNNRERFGMKLLTMRATRRAFETKNPFVLVLIADQSTSTTHNAIWADFFNTDTPCIHGPETYAKRYDIPVVFGYFYRVKRGYYRVKNTTLLTEPQKYEDGEITQMYMSKLEESIRQNPEQWMWTHKRWKHKRENGKLLIDYYYKKK